MCAAREPSLKRRAGERALYSTIPRQSLLSKLQVFLTTSHLCIAMEWCSGGMLFDRIVKMQRFSEVGW